jgi:hypothetical protein
MTAFLDIVPCSFVEVNRLFRGVYCFHQPENTSEMSVNFYDITWSSISACLSVEI